MPFLVTVNGDAVSIAFEDRAGEDGCDYDYNDRDWGGGSANSTGDPVIIDNETLDVGRRGP